MFESIRQQLMDWFVTRRHSEDNTGGLIISQTAKKIQTLVNSQAHRYRFIQSTNSIYEVLSKETLSEYIVNLDSRNCSCRQWQSTRIPCGHALAIILHRKEDPQAYAARFFTVEAYKNTYINPILHPNYGQFNEPLQFRYIPPENNESSDDDDDLMPPSTHCPTGRPKK